MATSASPKPSARARRKRHGATPHPPRTSAPVERSWGREPGPDRTGRPARSPPRWWRGGTVPSRPWSAARCAGPWRPPSRRPGGPGLELRHAMLVELDQGAVHYHGGIDHFAARADAWASLNDGRWGDHTFDPAAFTARVLRGVEAAIQRANGERGHLLPRRHDQRLSRHGDRLGHALLLRAGLRQCEPGARRARGTTGNSCQPTRPATPRTRCLIWSTIHHRSSETGWAEAKA